MLLYGDGSALQLISTLVSSALHTILGSDHRELKIGAVATADLELHFLVVEWEILKRVTFAGLVPRRLLLEICRENPNFKHRFPGTKNQRKSGHETAPAQYLFFFIIYILFSWV